MNKEIRIQTEGDFQFNFYIEKAVVSEEDGKMGIKGVASTTNIDHDGERMSAESLNSMAKIINESTVPLRVEHQKDDGSIVGNVNKAWVDSRNQLWIEADLDKSHPAAKMLYKALKTGAKLGLSVGGRVKRAVKEFSEKTGKIVKTFYDVVLDEVSVCQRPANYDAWLVQKHIAPNMEDAVSNSSSPFYKGFYEEFLREVSGFDYMQTFAKSIPSDANWKEVEINKNNNDKNMSVENKEKLEKKETETETTETKEKAESTETETKEKKDESNETSETANKSEEAFKSFVIKGLETLTNIVSKLSKTSSETEKTEETTIMEDKTKTEKETETETKEKAETETETKEKAETETETKEKTEDETETETKEKKEYGADYQMKSMTDLLTKMEGISKAMDGETTTEETKEKTEDTKETEETTEKSASMSDVMNSVNEVVSAIEEKLAKSGKRVLGTRAFLMDMLKNDKEFQTEIQKMIKEPGFKKSISIFSPLMKTKEGKTFEISAKEVGEKEVKKNISEKSFKDLWKTDFSPASEAEEK